MEVGENMIDNKSLYSIEAEQSLLGAMFLSKNAVEVICEKLTPDVFYLESHSKIFEAIASLADKKKPIDITTVTVELENRNWMTQIGGIEYLSEVVQAVPTAANVNHYIEIVEEKALLRRLIDEATEIINSCYKPTDDVNELIDKAEMKILNVARKRNTSEFRSIQDVMFQAQSQLEKLAENRGQITGLATGFYDVDKLTSGLHENELIIIAARPAMGKTAFALNIATNIACNTEKGVAIFNLEMGAEQLAMRMISSLGQIEGYKLRNGSLQHEDWRRVNEAISQLADTKIFMDDTPGITIGEIRAKCRRLASSESGLGIVIIDYLQLIQGSGKNGTNRQQEISEISRSLKTMAMELNVPVIALSQLSRAVEGREDKRPMLSDLRESGSIEQDADIVSFLFREDYYNKELRTDDNISKSEFIVAKHRNGATKTIDLVFKGDTSTFRNFAAVPEEGV